MIERGREGGSLGHLGSRHRNSGVEFHGAVISYQQPEFPLPKGSKIRTPLLVLLILLLIGCDHTKLKARVKKLIRLHRRFVLDNGDRLIGKEREREGKKKRGCNCRERDREREREGVVEGFFLFLSSPQTRRGIKTNHSPDISSVHLVLPFSPAFLPNPPLAPLPLFPTTRLFPLLTFFHP